MPNDWGQWWLGIGSRCEGVGTTALASTSVVPSSDGLLAGMTPFALDTSAGSGGTLEPTQDATTGANNPRLKIPTRLRPISVQTAQRAFRQERADADYTGVPNAFGSAIISTRDSVSIGFGLEQITDAAAREEVVRRAMSHLLPAAADTTAPTVTWLRPGDGATVNAADPVEIEVEGVDERGDIKEVRLSVGGTQVARKVSFPFQMRWQPATSDVGQTKTLAVDVEDKAGNITTSTRTITVGTASAMEEAPLPTGVTTLSGKPVVGETLTCLPSGFSGNGVELTYAWLRDGAAIAGATGASYVPTAADVGRSVSCRVTATRTARRRGLDLGRGDGLHGRRGSPGPQGPAGPADCRARPAPSRRSPSRARRRRSGRSSAWSPRGPADLARHDSIRKTGTSKTITRRARGRMTVRLNTTKTIGRNTRVVVRYTNATWSAGVVVRLGKTTRFVATAR